MSINRHFLLSVATIETKIIVFSSNLSKFQKLDFPKIFKRCSKLFSGGNFSHKRYEVLNNEHKSSIV